MWVGGSEAIHLQLSLPVPVNLTRYISLPNSACCETHHVCPPPTHTHTPNTRSPYRRESEEAKAAAAPTKASGPAAAPLIGDAASDELAQRLKLRAQKLQQQQAQQEQQGTEGK